MSVKSASANFVASGLCHDSLAEAAEQRAYHQYAAAQGGTLLDEVFTFKVFQVEVVGLETVFVVCQLLHLHAYVAQKLYEVVHVENVGNVLDAHLAGCEQCGADHFQSFVLGSLWLDGAAQRVSALDDE